MFTLGIIIVVIATIALMVWHFWFIETAAGTITLIRTYGGKIVGAMEAGLGFVPKPFRNAAEIVTIDRRSINFDSCLMTCRYMKTARVQVSTRQNKLSLAYELDFWSTTEEVDLATNKKVKIKVLDKEKLLNFFKLTDEQGSISDDKIHEFLKDHVEGALIEAVKELELDEIISLPKSIIKQAEESLQGYIDSDKMRLPINVLSLISNASLDIEDMAVRESYYSKGKNAAELAAATETMELQLRLAKQKVEIAKQEALALQTKNDGIALSLGLKLDDPRRFAVILEYESVQGNRDLARNQNAKVVLSSNLGADQRSSLASFASAGMLAQPNTPASEQSQTGTDAADPATKAGGKEG